MLVWQCKRNFDNSGKNFPSRIRKFFAQDPKVFENLEKRIRRVSPSVFHLKCSLLFRQLAYSLRQGNQFSPSKPEKISRKKLFKKHFSSIN